MLKLFLLKADVFEQYTFVRVHGVRFLSKYMPYENGDCNAELCNEFSSLLYDIRQIINDNSHYHSIVGSDFNVDFDRE